MGGEQPQEQKLDLSGTQVGKSLRASPGVKGLKRREHQERDELHQVQFCGVGKVTAFSPYSTTLMLSIMLDDQYRLTELISCTNKIGRILSDQEAQNSYVPCMRSSDSKA